MTQREADWAEKFAGEVLASIYDPSFPGWPISKQKPEFAQALRRVREEALEEAISEVHNHNNQDGAMLRHNIENAIRALKAPSNLTRDKE